jgi:hypothetical protein
MIKVWILTITTAMAPNVDARTQEVPISSEEACRQLESPPTILKSGLYWSAHCDAILAPKPKEKK